MGIEEEMTLFRLYPLTHSHTAAMFSRFAQTTLRNARGYATAASPKSASSSGVAPYFLGAGLAGSALFYYSTRDQRTAPSS